jgi:hypothetical protein
MDAAPEIPGDIGKPMPRTTTGASTPRSSTPAISEIIVPNGGHTGLVYDPQDDLRLSAVGVGTLTTGLGPISDYQPDPAPDYASSGIVRLSAVEVGTLAAGLGPIPLQDQNALTTPDYASSGMIRHPAVTNDVTTAGQEDMQERVYQPHSSALPRQKGQVPLQDQGIPSRSSGQNFRDNTTIHQSERENPGAPGLGAGFMYDNGRCDHDINNGGDRDDEFGGREHDDRNYDPQPLHNDDVYDQTGPSCAAANRHGVHNKTLMGETESEELREARVRKRQMSSALVTTEQRSHEEIARKASRMDAAQHQIVSKQLSEFVPQSSFGNPGLRLV